MEHITGPKLVISCTITDEEMEQSIYEHARNEKARVGSGLEESFSNSRSAHRFLRALLAIAVAAVVLAGFFPALQTLSCIVCGMMLLLAWGFLYQAESEIHELVEPEKQFLRMTPQEYCRGRLAQGYAADLIDTMELLSYLYVCGLREIHPEDIEKISFDGETLFLYPSGDGDKSPLALETSITGCSDAVCLTIGSSKNSLTAPKELMDRLLAGETIYTQDTGEGGEAS
jgi:hypothetical protein